MTISKSPERNTFQKEGAIKRAEEAGKEVNPAYLQMWETEAEMTLKREADPEWQKDNMEYDLRTTDWILEKVRSNELYAQNLYAAMCNMQFQKLDVIPILKEQKWSCSWRHAGGIIANMLQKGDYIDWYCSGIGGLTSYYPEEGRKAGYVPEGTVTAEIAQDLQKLGWVHCEWPDE